MLIIIKLYADFVENEYCKIYSNEEFIYHEYAVMQPLQRSYAIAEDHIQTMLSKDSLSSFYDSAKVEELENMAEPTGKDIKKLEAYQNNSPVYEATTVSDEVNYSPVVFLPVPTKVLSQATADKKRIEKIADGHLL